MFLVSDAITFVKDMCVSHHEGRVDFQTFYRVGVWKKLFVLSRKAFAKGEVPRVKFILDTDVKCCFWCEEIKINLRT